MEKIINKKKKKIKNNVVWSMQTQLHNRFFPCGN